VQSKIAMEIGTCSELGRHSTVVDGREKPPPPVGQSPAKIHTAAAAAA
jgi:hypothetical protein